MNMTSFWRAAVLAITVLALPLTSTAASASSVRGKITKLHARGDGLHYVIMDAPTAGRPPCAAYTPYYMIKAESSTSGASQFAMLMSAYLTGRTISVEGTGACTRWLDGEDIQLVTFD